MGSLPTIDPKLSAYFDEVCDRIAAHPAYSAKIEDAARRGEALLLNYHTHGPGEDYCVSVCIRPKSLAEIGVPAHEQELAHIRGIGRSGDECEPLMGAFAERLSARYDLKQLPAIFLDGLPVARK